MTKFYLITIGVLALIVLILIFVLWVYIKVQKMKLENEKNKIIKAQNEKTEKATEIISNATKEKSNIRSGDDVNNFNSSLNVLQKYAKGRSADNSN